MISTFMDFGIVNLTDSTSIMTILRANHFNTSLGVTKIGNAAYLETNSKYICFTSSITKNQYLLFLMGTSIGNRVDRFKFYGNNYAKLPPCLPPNFKNDEQEKVDGAEPVKEQKKKPDEFEASSNPWTVTVKPNNSVWQDATFNIYGFIHSVHYLQQCTEVPQLCKYYGQFNN